MQTHYEFTVNGARLVADLSGALYWPAQDMLIVADLHFEKASAFAARGVALPPYDTAASLQRLAAAFQTYQPQRFVSLGDAFHDDDWPARMASHDRDGLAQLAASVETIWVTGNHDPTPPRGLAGTAMPVFRASGDGALVMRHEPCCVMQILKPGNWPVIYTHAPNCANAGAASGGGVLCRMARAPFYRLSVR